MRHRHPLVIAGVVLLCCSILTAAAQERAYELITPLTTLIPGRGPLPLEAHSLVIEITIPADAPADLGAGAYLQDDTGRWFHTALPEPLRPGRQKLTFPIDGHARLRNEPGGPVWMPHQRTRSTRYGIFLWSASRSRATVVVHSLSPQRADPPALPRQAHRLRDLRTIGPLGPGWSARTGERWELRCRPQPMPANAYDHENFLLELLATKPDGSTVTIQGFYRQPLTLIDRGDAEIHQATAPGEMVVRLRPDQPGIWRLRLRATWQDHNLEHDLADLVVSGEPWDDYIRVDADDPRFFAIGGDRFFWPVGINLRSITDLRSRLDSPLATDPTPNRGIFSYRSYIERLGRAGCDLIEVWMADWNIGLEGMPSTAGFHGVGNYHEGHAERLDQLLDAAYENGLRVLLVINHHGQASSRVDAEWDLNPYNRRNGGPLASATEIFTSALAHRGQERLRRYIIARYADHPAVFAWKLWTEIDLTELGNRTRNNGGENHAMLAWHRQASKRWQDLDPYGHPVSTHWSSNFTYVQRSIAELPSIDFIGIDAYHGMGRRDFQLPTLLVESTNNRLRGLHTYGKPGLVTEYGGSPRAGPPGQIFAEHHYAGWVALVSGHGGAPLLWWYEWIDQNEHFWPYRALRNFLAGEDLRHPDARSVPLPVIGSHAFCRAWARSGLILGYLLDPIWANHVPRRMQDGWTPMPSPVLDDQRLRISGNARPGPIVLEWWDASRGERLHSQEWQHPGGELTIPVPPFRRHLAFKLRRTDE